ncbi:hypothetical protein LAZ67_20002054 [Cordylochernes scorpioides]|uniref:Transposable element Tcb2 transposase n=1 Tax=Cordylochernes scorpioides TaxID=51811 RepID=A0ABY6LKI9_9ARAC|nr:hypothetical protein LAZ67_20002054 [Cordylochernes scorpioides]
MPGHRKRRQFKQTDAFTRGMEIGLKRAGWSIRRIAADTHLGASTVHRLWRRWLEQGNVAIYRNVGATRVTSARVDRRILRQAVAAPQATCTAILQHVQDTLDHSISTRTISRRLVANGLHSCRPLRRLPLTPLNRRQRLEWCRARSTWMTEWHRVVFSDESRFCLSSDSRCVRVWRRRGERSNPAAIVERPTVRQRGIMVWGAIAYDSRSPLLRIQGTMTAQRYVDDVLRPVTLPYLQGVPNALYQQDNARPHTARISQQALKDVQMLPWPLYSPDLSPIEHVWDIIGRRLHALPQPRSEDELWQMVEREWRAIPQDAIRTLIDSLPRRVAACIAVRVTKDLDMIRTSSKFVPRILTEEQKEVRMDVCKNMVEMTRTDPEWMQNIITGDETWVYQYDSEAKPLPCRLPKDVLRTTTQKDRTAFHPISESDKKSTYKSFKKELKKMKTDHKISDDELKEFLSNLSSPHNEPYIYGLPKTHKPETPLRPIVAFFSSPTAPLSRFIANFLKPFLQLQNDPFPISNTHTFIGEVLKIKPESDRIMVSFDVQALYPSLPHPLIISDTIELLQEQHIDTDIIQKITQLISICLDNCIFTYNSESFRQAKGSPMGSPLSTIIAEISMRAIDRRITANFPHDIFFWRRSICNMPYSPLSSTIARFLLKFGIKTYFTCVPTSGSLLRNQIMKLNEPNSTPRNAIYSIECMNCPKVYRSRTHQVVDTHSSLHLREPKQWLRQEPADDEARFRRNVPRAAEG